MEGAVSGLIFCLGPDLISLFPSNGSVVCHQSEVSLALRRTATLRSRFVPLVLLYSVSFGSAFGFAFTDNSYTIIHTKRAASSLLQMGWIAQSGQRYTNLISIRNSSIRPLLPKNLVFRYQTSPLIGTCAYIYTHNRAKTNLRTITIAVC